MLSNVRFIFNHSSPLGAVLLALCAAVASAAPGIEPVTKTTPTATSSQVIMDELNAVFRTQQADGSFHFKGSQEFFAEHPMLATMALASVRENYDAAFLSQSASAIGRYYNHMFTTADRDGDLLIETRVRGRDDEAVLVEDPGFNALLALDIQNLALLYLELRKPTRALYWYEGSRSIAVAVLAGGFDPESTFFFPTDARSGARLRDYYALSALGGLFDTQIGDNRAAALSASYLLLPDAREPETPSRFLSADFVATVSPARRDACLVRVIALCAVLERSGYTRAAAGFRDLLVAAFDRTYATSASRSAHEAFLLALLRAGDWSVLADRTAPLQIFGAVLRSHRAIDDPGIVRGESAVATIRTLFHGGTVADTDAESAARTLYWAVSAVRDLVRDHHFITRDDNIDLSGVDGDEAMTHLLDASTHALRRTENHVFVARQARGGPQVSAVLQRERAIGGTETEVRWSVSALGGPVDVRNPRVVIGQEKPIFPFEGTQRVTPGTPLTFSTTFTVRADRVNELVPIIASLSFENADGSRATVHAFRSIYVEQPVDVIAAFPRGAILDGTEVPIEIRLVKRVRDQLTIKGGWFSPSGLRLREGASFAITMLAEQDTALVLVHVLVPDPCRPGNFPTRLRFSTGDRDLGGIDTDLFRPFHWLSIGPFVSTDSPMTTMYPPERVIELYKGYPGAGQRVTWTVLPRRDYRADGRVAMRDVLPTRGIGFLYTVLESPYAADTPVVFSSTAPATVIVNGKSAIAYTDARGQLVRSPVHLNKGLNDVLIKVNGADSAVVYFNIGDNANLAPDEFNNNLWELIDGFGNFVERSAHNSPEISEESQKTVTFRYKNAEANTVSLIGSFNGWSPENARMRDIGGGAWEVSMSLAPGKHTYRFLVDNRAQVLDPSSPYTENDGYGGKNSIVYVK